MGCRRVLLSLQTLLVVVAGCSRTPDDVESRYRAVVRARALFESGETKAAQRLLERVVESERRPETLVNLGLVQRARLERDAAARSWNAALALDPADVRALVCLATLRLETAKASPARSAASLTEARILAERAAGVEAHNAAVQRLLAQVLEVQGDTAAVRVRREAERLDPKRAGAAAQVFGIGQLALPALRRAPHFTRTPPRFETKRLQIPATLAVAVDLDHNGLVDVILGGSGGYLRADSARAEADVPWVPVELLEAPAELVAPGPFDADAAMDLVTLTAAVSDSLQDTPARLWLVHGGPRPRCSPLGEFAGVSHLEPMDADRDGDLDLVLAVSDPVGLLLLRNDGNGSFAAAEAFPGWGELGPARTALAADLDGDGAMDLLCLDGWGRVRVLGARDAGAFVEITLLTGLSGQRARAAACADLDGDGDDDILLGDDEGLWLWLNEGAAHYVRAAAYREVLAAWTTDPERGVPVAAIHVADFDNDGLVDVVTQHFPAAPPVLATVTATPTASEDAAPHLRRLEPLLQVPAATQLALWHNEGNALLSDVTTRSGEEPGALGATALSSADFDRDGDLDLVGTAADSTIVFLWNMGGNVGRGVEVELEGVSRASSCFGVRVELYAGTQPSSVVLRGPVGVAGCRPGARGGRGAPRLARRQRPVASRRLAARKRPLASRPRRPALPVLKPRLPSRDPFLLRTRRPAAPAGGVGARAGESATPA